MIKRAGFKNSNHKGWQRRQQDSHPVELSTVAITKTETGLSASEPGGARFCNSIHCTTTFLNTESFFRLPVFVKTVSIVATLACTFKYLLGKSCMLFNLYYPTLPAQTLL